MASSTRRSKDVDRLLAEVDPRQREVAQALRELILEAAPELREVVKWGAPCYLGAKLVCSIAAHSDHTNLEFYHGTSLRDPKRLLEGTGKSLRHVKIHAAGDVKPALLKPLLREAVDLDAA
jgi:hypothetical protein